jgi:hypothetical protein
MDQRAVLQRSDAGAAGYRLRGRTRAPGLTWWQIAKSGDRRAKAPYAKKILLMARSGKNACILLPIFARNPWRRLVVRRGGVMVRGPIVRAICVTPHAGLSARKGARTLRVLITVSPRMYREALALSVHRHRPDLEVRIAPPGAIAEETRRFRPHLLVRNDNDGVEPEVLAEIPYWIEVLFNGSMNARISADGHVTEVQDIAMNDLLRLVDEKGS